MCSKMILMTTVDVNLVMFLLIIPFSVFPVFTVADHLVTFCSYNTFNYTFNSPFENNLKRLLETLPSITSLSGFNYTSFGESPAKVHGQALCRGDVNSSSCQACVEKASQKIFNDCRNYIDAIIWYELCQVHYSFQNMTSMSVYTGKYPEWDSQKKLISDPQHFSDVLKYLMTNLSSEAAFNPSKLMFATGEIKIRNETVYGHAQCTRDIIPNDCQTCLTTASAELKGCCSSRQGGIIVSRNCNVRFDLYKYYNASSYLLTYPSPKGSKWKIEIVAVAVCAPVVVIVIVIGSCIVCLLKKRGQQRGVERSHQALIKELACPRGVTMTEKGQLVSSEDLPFMDLTTISAATESFSENNKLGEGGFGTAWRLWNEGREMELVDTSLMERGQTEGIVRCIHVGLLCVQKDPADRPTMSFVVIALGSDPISLRQPKEPAFSLCKMVPVHKSSTTDPSVNQMSVSGMLPRITNVE
ncbi:hypothetical protein SADUNF_Sadunf04G0013600 [Salix dunnii]|uniref:Gnk2-homologous domain-containing protein n=1 Tax=Salix dunnii TaxID=1413687 RepID=A0A835N3U2_9ROSI|nr:hypothetical protein SADUNF_Sadunf04G0013600 [Salix dunnii]